MGANACPAGNPAPHRKVEMSPHGNTCGTIATHSRIFQKTFLKIPRHRKKLFVVACMELEAKTPR